MTLCVPRLPPYQHAKFIADVAKSIERLTNGKMSFTETDKIRMVAALKDGPDRSGVIDITELMVRSICAERGVNL